ncbi:MAG: hypothetical protein AUK35_08495 [Zetaproteobacteria bacterium CG2_30_46_52]|nr:MAG: hypothetical protein AUK35_08495 [Zetaproteobacteria bacterium CG2_30_46_52]
MSILNTITEQIRQQGLTFWENNVEPKYQALEQREQRIVLIAAIVLPIILFVFGLVMPILDKNKALQADITSYAAKLSEAQQLASTLAANPGQAESNSGSNSNLLSQVDKLARSTNVRTFMTRLRPQQIMGGASTIQVQMKDVPYASVVAFISALEKANLSITNLKLQSASTGLVQAQVVIGG